MQTKDEVDYIKEERADLIARLMGAQMMGHFLLRAYDALRSYGVDFKLLPEWRDQSELDDARRLKPHAAQWAIGAYFERLNNALTAAIRRKQFRLLNAPKPTTDT